MALPEGDPIEVLADWSPWLPFVETAASAPRLPGVYMARQGVDGGLVYVGMVGERRGQGIRGRLTDYRRGKGAVSGLGEAVLDRALADVEFIQGQLDELLVGEAKRAAVWAQGHGAQPCDSCQVVFTNPGGERCERPRRRVLSRASPPATLSAQAGHAGR